MILKILTLSALIISYGAIADSNAQVTEEWVKRINGPANGSDHGHDVETDPSGNVYVTGWIETTIGNPDCHTVKYSPDGTLQWAKTYAGSVGGTDYGYAITVDNEGNAYVGGFGNGTSAVYDIFIIKYTTSGDTAWIRRWTSPHLNYSAYAYSIAVDDEGNVYTTGFMSDGITSGEFITLKYNSSGTLLWAEEYGGPGTSIDYANYIAVDDSEFVYITGWSGGLNNLHDMTTIKYSPDGDTLWVRRLNGSADGNDYAYWLDLDNAGNVYVAGQSADTASGDNVTTIKYSPAGDLLWIQHYNGPANAYDAGWADAVDSTGNVYVTGNHTTLTGVDCVTLKYSAAGDLLWTKSYNGPGNGGDIFFSMAMDDSANVYVSGFVAGTAASDFATIRYSSSGNEDWVQLYDGAGSYDGTYAVTVDHSRNVYVTGYSSGSGTDYDYTTIKYSQSGTVGVEPDDLTPAEYNLSQNYPNPFNPSTKFSYELPIESKVRITVYNVLGQLQDVLVDEIKPAGSYQVDWSADNIVSGVYIYKIEAEAANGSSSFQSARKMILMK